jgi:hypothetical protein
MPAGKSTLRTEASREVLQKLEISHDRFPLQLNMHYRSSFHATINNKPKKQTNDLLVCSLVDDAVSRSEYVASIGMTINE